MNAMMTRRRFLSIAGLTSLSLGSVATLAACKDKQPGTASATQAAASPAPAGATHAAASPAPAATGSMPGMAMASATSGPQEGAPIPAHQVYDARPPQAGPETTKKLVLTTRNDTAIAIDKEVGYYGWSFNGTIPGPILRVRQGDTVETTITNKGTMGHSIDFHAAQTPWSKNYQIILPGDSFSFSWTANHAGVFMYHCGTPPVLEHIANGMYGAIIVDPPQPMRPAREYVIVQSEFYPTAGTGMRKLDLAAANAGNPRYVVFNGYANQYQETPLTAKAGELIRLYVVNAGPTLWSAFHVIGALFESVYPSGSLDSPLHWLQTWSIAPGDGAIFELTIPDPGTYPFVTHSFAYTGRGAIGLIKVE